ncbi:hypothetical protein, partial [Vibrio atypicus]|uniref:hypothetical protein n=1 Tax=Vibrio atypicus TaxID=558271 RepID=UPI001C20A17E
SLTIWKADKSTIYLLIVKFSMFVFMTNTNTTHSSVLGNVTLSDYSKLSPAKSSLHMYKNADNFG